MGCYLVVDIVDVSRFVGLAVFAIRGRCRHGMDVGRGGGAVSLYGVGLSGAFIRVLRTELDFEYISFNKAFCFIGPGDLAYLKSSDIGLAPVK